MPSPSTLAAIRDAGAWDLFTRAGRGARRAANPRFEPADVTMFRSGSTEEVGDAGVGGVDFARGAAPAGGAVKVTPVGAAEKVGERARFAADGVGPDLKAGGAQVTSSDADALFDRLRRQFPGLPPVSVVAYFADLPAELQEAAHRAKKDPKTVKGVMHRGTVYVVVGNHVDVADLETTVMHEIVGHAGLRPAASRSWWARPPTWAPA